MARRSGASLTPSPLHPFFTGAMVPGCLPCGGKSVHGRAVGVALGRTDTLLIAHNAGNAVWRISRADS